MIYSYCQQQHLIQVAVWTDMMISPSQSGNWISNEAAKTFHYTLGDIFFQLSSPRCFLFIISLFLLWLQRMTSTVLLYHPIDPGS